MALTCAILFRVGVMQVLDDAHGDARRAIRLLEQFKDHVAHMSLTRGCEAHKDGFVAGCFEPCTIDLSEFCQSLPSREITPHVRDDFQDGDQQGNAKPNEDGACPRMSTLVIQTIDCMAGHIHHGVEFTLDIVHDDYWISCRLTRSLVVINDNGVM